MAKLLMNLFSIPFLVGMQILVMINGWGLEPQSWWWIIGVGVIGHMTIQLVLAIGNRS